MHTSTLLSTMLTLASSVLAQQPQFEITALTSSLPVGPPYGTGNIDFSIRITVTYPEPTFLTNETLSTTCSHIWPAGTSPGPTDWAACQDALVQWRLPSDGWTNDANYKVEFFETLDGASGLDGSHYLDMNPGNTSDPNAYLSCIQYGKFQPRTCQLGGALSVQQPPVIIPTTEKSTRPN
ncbi:hypothetical protein BJ170DRAFT_637589 [Xylariales sp. AK1849]|nr:hypothetical protein BJ170DRAFT_637589 [Xylariales sp. AK1849]